MAKCVKLFENQVVIYWFEINSIFSIFVKNKF